MKKNILLTLVSLVIFAGSAWGNYKFSYPTTVTLASTVGDHKTIEFGGTANITAFACSLKTKVAWTSFNMSIGSTYEGTDLYEGNPGEGKTTKIYHSKVVTCSTPTIYFKNTIGCAGRECSNMVFTIATATPSIADAILFSTTTCTFNVFSGTAISTANFTSTDTNFAVTAVSLVKDYCYSVTISFSPTNVGSYSSTIKLNGEDAATVSAKGLLPTPTTALDATEVTHKSFVANWEASDLEGAKYNVDVYDAEGTNIASASNIEENYFEVSNLDPESTYTYVAYVVVGDAVSEASNAISVTTLSKPTITPVTDEYQLFSDTGIEGLTSVLITTVNITEATATITGDAEFYFKDADGNPVTTKTLPIEAEGPTEFELYSMFTAGGEYSAIVTISAVDADDAIVSVTATATLVVPATTALDATDVTFNSFTANWEASDMEGATYSIDVKNANDETIASASGLEETSYAVSNLDPESNYTYVVYVVVGDATSEASNTIEVTTLAKPAIEPVEKELIISTDTDIEGKLEIIFTTVNVTEVTATIDGDAGFYFKDGESQVLTKTVTVEPEGPTDFELFALFTEEGVYNATITLTAEGAEDVTITATANVSKPTDVPVNTTTGIVKSFNNGLLLLNGNYANIVVSNLAGKTVAEAKGNSVNVAAGYIYIVKTVDLKGNTNSFMVK